MGKISGIFVFLLMINIIGYVLTAGAIQDGVAFSACGTFDDDSTLLKKFYSSKVLVEDNSTVYFLENESVLAGAVPQNTPDSFTTEGISFVDRIFILFGFVQIIFSVILFPLYFMSFTMCFPPIISMLLFLPLMALYLLGLIDLLSGGSS